MKLISTRYAFTSAYLKGEEARGITTSHVEGMVQRAKTAQEVLEIIKDTDIGEYLSETAPTGWKTFDAMDESLSRYFADCVDRLNRFKLPSDMSRMLDRYTNKFDIMNIKIALRGKLSDTPFPLIPFGKLHSQSSLDDLSNATNTEEIADVLVSANLGDYAVPVKDIKEKDFRAMIEGEFRLDDLFNQKMSRELRDMNDGSILSKAWGIMIDLANLQIVFRSALGERGSASEFLFDGGHMLSGEIIREMLSLKPGEITSRLENTEYQQIGLDIGKNYEKEGVITVVDKVIERHRIKLLGDLLSPRALSPCNLLWYLILKELEIRNVRVIFKTLRDGVPLSDIRDYVVTVS